MNDPAGGSQHPGSGRFWQWKRDGILWNFLIEARTTESESYRVSAKEFQDIRREAVTTPPGLKPAMQIDIGETRLWLMELRDWDEIYTRLAYLESQHGED